MKVSGKGVEAMPMYEFYCNDCKKEFNLILSVKEYEEYAKKNFPCATCHGKNVERLITTLHVITPKKS